MRRKFIQFFVIAGLFTAVFTSCYKDDFNDLQNQVDELEKKVAANAASIEDQIAAIQALQQQDENLSQQIQDVVTELESVKNDVEQNAKTVFYGNLITDEDYAAYEAAGADVVTGKVLITTKEQANIVSNCRWIGQELITEIGSIEGIQNVGGDFIVNSTDTVISVKGLMSIGGDFSIPMNDDLQTVSMDDLVLLAGEFSLSKGLNSLTSISMQSLELAGSVFINGDNTHFVGGKTPVTINLNEADVALDLYITKINNNETSFGNVGGNVDISYCDVNTFNFTGTNIGGGFSFTFNTTETVNADKVEMIGGDVIISSNNGGGWGPVSVTDQGSGLSTLNFDALTVIDGDVSVMDNKSLFDILNNVETVNGDIELGAKVADGVFIAFEKLVEAGNITLFEGGQLKSLEGFNDVTSVRGIHIGGDKYVVGESFSVFNSLSDMGSFSVDVRLYKKSTYYPSLDLSNSFTNLIHAYKINIHGYESYGNYSESELLAGAFPGLKKCGAITLDGKIIYNEGFAKLDSVDNIYLANGANNFSLPALTSMEKIMSVKLNTKNDDVTLSFPNLVSAGKIYLYGYEEGANITMVMPKLESLTGFYYFNYAASGTTGSPASINAPMSSLTGISTIKINFKNATTPVDVSKLFTGLTTLIDAGWSTSVYFEYIDGQKFCGMTTFLKNIDLDAFGSKVTFKKDGIIQDDAEAIADITTCD